MNRYDCLADKCSIAVTLFFKNNYLVILAGFLAGIYVNGFDITNTILSIDKEFFWQFNSTGSLWLEQGRWGMFLLNKIIPTTSYQFISQITGILFLSLSGALIVSKYKNISTGAKTIFCVLFTTAPVFVSMEVFSYQIAYYHIGIFLAVVSYKIFEESLLSRKYSFLFPSLAFLIISTGCYQSLVAFFPSVFAVSAFMSYINGDRNIKTIFKLAILVILFMALALLGNSLVLHILGTASNEYNNVFFHWNKLSIYSNVTGILMNINRVLFGSVQYYKLNIVACLMLLVAIIHIINNKNQKWYKTLLGILCLIALLIGSTQAMRLALGGGFLVVRILAAISIFFAGAVLIYYVVGSKIEKLFVTVFVIFSVFYHGSVATRQFMAGYYTLESDKTVANLILSRVYDIAPGFYTGRISIAFIGNLDYGKRSPLRIQNEETLGGSFWQWDNGNPNRMLNFMRIMNGLPMRARLAEGDDYQKAKDYSNSMPTWPNKESVKLHKGVVIVKFSDIN